MSYMNDDTDPFGVPYSKEKPSITFEEMENKEKEESVKYSLKDYNELLNQKEEFTKTLQYLEEDINAAKAQIADMIHRITDGVIKEIIFQEDKIIILFYNVSLSALVKLKEELSLKDIEIRTNKGGCFKLDLLW